MTSRDIGINLKKEKVQKAGKRYGLVIGINTYSDQAIPNLKYAVNDANALKEIMLESKIGFFDDVILLADEEATSRSIVRALHDMHSKVNEEDTFWIYYAGHAAPSNGEYFWLPSDIEKEHIYTDAISQEMVNKYLSKINCKRKVMIMDCCYAEGMAPNTRNVIDGNEIIKKYEGSGSVILMSSNTEETSVELDHVEHGAFTFFLAEGLRGQADRDKKGVVTVDDLWDYLRSRVADEAKRGNHIQTPIIDNRSSHNFPLTVNYHVLEGMEKRIDMINGLIGIGSDQLTTDEAKVCIHALTDEENDEATSGLKQVLMNQKDYSKVLIAIKQLVAYGQGKGSVTVPKDEEVVNFNHKEVKTVTKQTCFEPDSVENIRLTKKASLVVMNKKSSEDDLIRLIEAGWNTLGVDEKKKSAFEIAISSGRTDFVEFFIRQGQDVDGENSKGEAFIIQAVKENQVEIVGVLIEHLVDWTIRDGDGVSVLRWAIELGRLEVIEKLIAVGADVNEMDHTCTHFQNAIMVGEARVVEFLINHGADIYNTDKELHWTSLDLAIYKEHMSIVELLIEYGGAKIVNVEKESKGNPLHQALYTGKIDIVRMLIDAGADVNVEDESGRSALFAATIRHQKDIVALLLENGADDGWNKYHRDAALGALPPTGSYRFTHHNNYQGQLFEKSKYNWTPLLLAVEMGNLDYTKDLVQWAYKEDLNIRDLGFSSYEGDTLLIRAIVNGNEEIIESLIMCKDIDVNMKDKHGNMPIFSAIELGQVNTLKLLLEAGVAVGIRDDRKESPLSLAISKDNPDIVKLLVEKGVDLKETDRYGGLIIEKAKSDEVKRILGLH